MEYVITDGNGYLDYDGCFGDIRGAIAFDLYQAIAVCGATGWDYMEESDMLIDEIEDWSLSHDWDEDEIIEQMEAFLASDIEPLK